MRSLSRSARLQSTVLQVETLTIASITMSPRLIARLRPIIIVKLLTIMSPHVAKVFRSMLPADHS